MAFLSRDHILTIKPRTEVVAVPEWGGDVEISELTIDQQSAIAQSVKGRLDADAQATVKAFLEGCTNPKFDAGDYDALRALGAGAMSRVVGRILRLSGMTPEAQAEILGK